MKKTAALLLAFLLALPLAARAQENDAARNANRLTLEMAQAVMKHQADKSDNAVVSPYNALMALAMLADGAGGNTRAELAKALFGVEADGFGDAEKSFLQLNTGILATAKGHVDLLTANGLWVNRKMAELKPAYADKVKDAFAAEVSASDFADPATVTAINGWASKNTKGLITKIVEQLSADDAIVLASALYFKGKWTYPFDKAETKDATFTEDGGHAVTTPMMHHEFDETGQVVWGEGKDYEAVALRYGPPEDYSVRLILVRPKDASTGARDWLAAQDASKTPAWLDNSGFQSVTGTVELPHIDISQHHKLIPALQDAGIHDAFGGAADFGPMATSSAPLFVSDVSHDIVFKTDEEGSEAAAVTSIMMAGSAMMQEPKRIDIKFDRSFVFALQDTRSGAVLFIGAVNKPNKELKD